MKIQSKINRHLLRHANHATEDTATLAAKETTDGSGEGLYFLPLQLDSPIVKKTEPWERKADPGSELVTPLATAPGAKVDTGKTGEEATRLLSM